MLTFAFCIIAIILSAHALLMMVGLVRGAMDAKKAFAQFRPRRISDDLPCGGQGIADHRK